MDAEDWDLSAEDLDSLERDAFQKIAQLRNPPPPSSPLQHHNSATATTNHFPPKPLPNSLPQTVKLLSFLIAVNLRVMGPFFLYVKVNLVILMISIHAYVMSHLKWSNLEEEA